MAQEQYEQSMSTFKQKLRMPLDSLSLCLAFTLESSLDNFRAPSRDEELITGALEIVLCYPRIILRFYMLVANLLPALALVSADNLIFVDTGVAVLVCYVLLLDINWSFIWLAIFPIMAIIFIYALSQLYRKAYSGGGEYPEEAGVIQFPEIKEAEDGLGEANRGSSSTGGCSNEKTTRNTVELEFIGIITFGSLWAMDQLLLDEHPTHRFTISQFLLFLSFMLAILTCMMMRLPAGVSPGIARASELLHKTLLVLLLVTAHTVAAEALGEEVVLICMPEVIPAVLIWFSIHHGSVIGRNDLEAYKKWRIVLPPAVALAFATMDESVRPGWCTTILVYCAVSGFLAHYVVFMLSHWPGQQPSGKQDPVELLKYWANDLLIAAASSLLLRYVLVSGIGWRAALDALCQNFQRLNLAVKGETKTFWSIMPLLCSALFNLWISRFRFENNNLWSRSKNLQATLQKSFGFCYSVFLGLHACCFTDDVSRILSTIVLNYFGKE